MWSLTRKVSGPIQNVHVCISFSLTPGKQLWMINLLNIILNFGLIWAHPLLTIPLKSVQYMTSLFQIAWRVSHCLPMLHSPLSDSFSPIIFLLASQVVSIPDRLTLITGTYCLLSAPVSIYLQLSLPIHNDSLFLLLGIFNYTILINMQLHSSPNAYEASKSIPNQALDDI